MLARRAQGGSATILGDLAQSTSPGGQERWDHVVVQLGAPERHQILELEAGIDAGAAERGGLDRAVTILDPPTAKGLELDAVVVVEPARFLAEGSAGARLLYIAMTRCVQHLSVVHAEPLPELLSEGAPTVRQEERATTTTAKVDPPAR